MTKLACLLSPLKGLSGRKVRGLHVSFIEQDHVAIRGLSVFHSSLMLLFPLQNINEIWAGWMVSHQCAKR